MTEDEVARWNAAQPNRTRLEPCDHPNATDWQNRCERAEAECAELRRAMATHDGLTLAVGLTQLQARYDALLMHAQAMAGLLAMPEVESQAWRAEQQEALAAFTAWQQGKD